MTTKKWALRIIGAVVGFTAVIWITAPANATDVVAHQSPEQIITYVEQQASCYSLALAAENSDQMTRHTAKLKAFFDEYQYVITYTIGYTDGYLKAVSYMTKRSAKSLAEKRHADICLEQI